MNKVYLHPSFYAHIINGLLLFFIIILLYINFSKIIKLDLYKQINLLLLLSLTIGIHGLSHLGLEKGYDYNPISALFY